MAVVSMMRLLVAAALCGTVSARLGTGEVEVVPSYFGEAAVTSDNAVSSEVPVATRKSSILISQTTIETATKEIGEEPGPSIGGSLQTVCERTRTALAAQGDASTLPTGPVYKECMAALAPLRDAQQDSDAVDTLSDCMAIVNALVANKGGDCNAALDVMQAARKPVTAAAVTQPEIQAVVSSVPTRFGGKAVEAAAAKPKPTPLQLHSKQEANALDLVSEAMTAVCTETVHDAEVGIKSEADAMKTAAAPICQQYAEKHLGSAAAATPLTIDWCHQLDGRLKIALETGFFFALQPEEAERQAAQSNPYAQETRRKFCSRFVNSLRHQAQEATAAKPVVARAAVISEPTAPLPTIPPAPKAVVAAAAPNILPAAAPVAVPVKVAPVPVVAISNPAPQQEKPKAPMPFPKGTGVDTLRLVQALSVRSEWNAACIGMISRLTSEEGSVTQEYALGEVETAQATKVLTFNAADQGQIQKCAAQLKVLAIQSGISGDMSSSGKGKEASLVATGASLSSAEDAEAIMDSPWAADACGDIAHGYLTAHLAHPNLAVANYCTLYAKDVQAMHGAMPLTAAAQAKQDVEQMRKRGSKLKRKTAQAAQAPITAMPALRVPAKHPAAAALITEDASEEDQEGMDFWTGTLQ